MFSVAIDVLQDTYSAEDAVQNAFIKIINHIDIIDELESNRTKRLIITITKNAAIDLYRKRHVQWTKESSLDEATQLSQDTMSSSENSLFAAIQKLPDIYQDILMLKYSSGFSNSEIAAILEITEPTVRKRLSRGRKQLENILKKEGIK